MGDVDDFDLDRVTRQAWARFQGRLADHVAAMRDDDVLLVEVEAGVDSGDVGTTPYAQFCAWGRDLVRAEVSSNVYLDERYRLDEAAGRRVVAFGWEAPTHGRDDMPDAGSANFFADLQRREADRLAAMTVAVLRDVFGVAHPAFLMAPGLATSKDVAPEDAATVEMPVEGPVGGPDEPLAVMPESLGHLRALVEAALTPPGGPPLEYDEDGDIPMPYGTAVVFVHVNELAAVVELYSIVVQGVEDLDRAAFEVAALNRDNRLLKLVLIDDYVLATFNLPAMPFAAANLRAVLPVMAEAVDRIDDDLVARVGGRRAFEPEPERPAPSNKSAPGPREPRGRRRAFQPSLFGDAASLDPSGQAELFEVGDDESP